MGHSGRPTPKLEATCSDRVRSQFLGQLGPGEEPGVELLHALAREIAGQCTHGSFKAHRIAWGWTIAEAVDAFHDMCRQERIKRRGLVARSWMEWEAGSRPSWDYQDLLSRLFCTSPVQLGWAADYAPASADSERVPGTASLPGESAERSGAILHLPPDTGDFTGRAEQVDTVVRIISATAHHFSDSVPVASISGKPGVGKTTLAIRVAHLVKGAFPDGQIYANLHGAESRAADPSDVLAGFLRELGVDGAHIPEGIDERARMYRAQLARRRVLVVLDNAADESQVRPLLPGGRGCAVLVTSRTRMAALAGANSIPLDVMSSMQATDLLAAIIGSERALAEPEALAEIARHCGYLPLALRIAGARLLSRPAWQISWFGARLRDESRRLDMLRAGDLEVRASFALSYHSRDAAEQRAFRMLGLINSDFPAWNLAVLLSENVDYAEQVLEQLVDAELIEIVGVDAAGLIRYRLHDLLRDFAREAVNDTEPTGARRKALCRLVRQYADSAQLASALLHPGDTYPDIDSPLAESIIRADPWRWFTSERANLVAMVDQSHTAGLWEETWRLAESLPAMLEWRADWRSWESTHRLALDATRAARDDHAEAVILRSLGALYRELGRYDDAADLLNRAAVIFDGLGDRSRWAASMRSLGDNYRYQGRLAEAIDAFSAAFDVFDSTSDRRSAAGALNGMAEREPWFVTLEAGRAPVHGLYKYLP
jgi:tetratricopeptide (TPR) repeat protein